MTEQTCLQQHRQRLQNYRKFEQETVKPFLEELWYLRVPAFTAVLSFVFFALIGQTLEVYRTFALNPGVTGWHIVFSFFSIFFLSLVIWHSGEAFAKRRVAELAQMDPYSYVEHCYYYLEKKHKGSLKQIVNFACNGICITLNGIRSVLCLICQDMKYPKCNLINRTKDVYKRKITFRKAYSKATALLFLPRLLGFLPILALSFGLFRASVGFGLFSSDNIITGFWGTILALLIITIFIAILNLQGLWVGGLLILFFPLIRIFSKTETLNGQECIKTIFNINIGCQSSPVLYLVFGILITVSLSFWYFNVLISRKKPGKEDDYTRYDIPKGKLLSPFELSNSSDLLFSNLVLVFLGNLSIFSLYIFTIPLITNVNVVVKVIIGLVYIAFLLFHFSKEDSKKITPSEKEHADRYKVQFGYLILFLTISFLILLFVPSVVPLVAPYIGSIIIIALFLIMFLTLSSTIFYVEYKTRIPFITILLIWVLVLGFFSRNDNHHLRELTERPNSLLPLETEFKKWIESRKDDIAAFKEYPIYVVSAQGGGIFAAYHAASTLSRLQDLCPAFAHHVFAISGVSGGSLGATTFSSLVKVKSEKPQFIQDCLGNVLQKDLTNDRGPLENYAHQLLEQDLLSPLLAAGLFPDFFQRFYPFPLEFLDRARGLEYAFEQGWKNEWSKPNPLKGSFYDHWKPESAAPALVLNTTVVETGERLLLSPFTFKTPDSSTVKFSDLVDISTVAHSKFDNECKDKNNSYIDFPLSTAAVLSARFPFVTPVGWFNRCYDKEGHILPKQEQNSKSRLADGGYFENSGFSTAFNIGQGLEEILNLDGSLETQKIKVVYLALTDNSLLNQQSGGNDLFSPINALFNSREARGRSIIEQAEYKIDRTKEKENVSKHNFRQFYLTHYDPGKQNEVSVSRLDGKIASKSSGFKLPLGWYLSKFSQDYIRDRIGNPIACDPDKPADNNHCVMKSIIEELKLSS